VQHRPLRWTLIFHLLIFDSLLYYIQLTGVPLSKMSPTALVWLTGLFVLPFLVFWGTLAIVAIFLLPVKLRHWRQWQMPMRALMSFARGANYPYFAYDEETNQLKRHYGGSITARHGGPGIILLRPEHAVVLHRGAQITRVVGGDIVFTERLERVLQLVDLRKHILVMLNTRAVSKDGISIKFPVIVLCRINPTDAPEQPARLYPFNPDAVFRVVSQEDVAENERLHWYNLIMQKAQKAACDIMATYPLERLLMAEDPDEIPRGEIRARIEARLIADVANSDIEIPWAGIGNIEPVETAGDEPAPQTSHTPEDTSTPISVSKERVVSWQTKWQRQTMVREARSQAEAIRIVEEARAQALTELIHTVSEGFQQNPRAEPGQIIALSFIDAIEQMYTVSHLQQSPEGIEAQTTMQNLRRIMLLSDTQQRD